MSPSNPEDCAMLADAEQKTEQAASAAAVADQAVSTANGPDSGAAISPLDRSIGALERATRYRACLASQAMAERDRAISAAADDAEAEMIRRVFDDIPLVLKLSQAHGEAEVTDAPDERERQAAWLDAQKRVGGTAVAILDLAPGSAETTLRRIALYRRVLTLTEGANDGVSFEDVFAEDFEIVGKCAIRALEAMARTEASEAKGRAVWAAAMLAYEDASAAYREVSDGWDALNAAVTARAPAWNIEPRVTDGAPVLRFTNLTQHTQLGRRGDEAIRKDLEAWMSEEAASLAEMDRLADECEARYDRFCDVERALIETPAPDLAAVVFKQRLFGRETDDEKVGYKNPAYASAQRDASAIIEAWPVFIHEDCLRLAGISDPLLETELFKPRQWLNRFVEVGGKASVEPITHKLNIEAPETPKAAGLVAELDRPHATDALVLHLAGRL